MKIGLDIASLAYKKLVSKIILIAGDSDFVPASKFARREGIEFILDPIPCAKMFATISSNTLTACIQRSHLENCVSPQLLSRYRRRTQRQAA